MINNLFQLDIETTGVNPDSDDILQITIVQMVPTTDGYYNSGRVYNRFIHTDRSPVGTFAVENMQECYKVCNNTAYASPEEIRSSLIKFLEGCGATGPTAVFCGLNASSFDVPFLVRKGFLKPSGYAMVNGKEVKVGDFSYRVYELSGVLFSVQDALKRTDRNELIEECIEKDLVIPMPTGSRHDGLVDCLRQIKMLNGLLSLIRESKS